uniref:RING-type domain-containing protein n=1 Tax=Oreochromis niloticus TaxID=8128 RepID=A0A669EEY0_ORENI
MSIYPPSVVMAAASCLLSEDQFLCCICLEVFTDPVSTPCGHNFCKNCITQYWNSSPLCQCPVCKRKYYTRPELHVNTFISEMAAQHPSPHPEFIFRESCCPHQRLDQHQFGWWGEL